MQKRTPRRVVAVLLVAAGIAGGFFVFRANRAGETILASNNDVVVRLQRLIDTVGSITSAQQAYVAPGQPSQQWAEQSATLLRRFSDELAKVRPRLRSDDSMRAVGVISQTFRDLTAIDEKAQLDLQQSENLLAADLIFSEGRDAVTMLTASIRSLIAAETSAAEMERADFSRQQWGVLAILGLTWLGGLMLLVPLPVSSPTLEDATRTIDLRPAKVEPAVAPSTPRPAAIDLDRAAQVCASLAQVGDAASMPGVLARAADVLDARGIIVWMGAGEELFPTVTYGYDKTVVRRLGPIARDAANATAEAWRTGHTCTVASDATSHGALAVPLVGAEGCVGIFAAEIRHGRETDPAFRAMATMFAAQLAAILPVWPAASVSGTNIAQSGSVAASGHA